MSLRPYKFIVQAIVQETDATGAVVGEKTSEPITVYGCDQLAEWASGFPNELAAASTGPTLE